MQTTILEQPALRLISAKASRFPEGTRDAFAAIESKLSSLRGRRMYGLVFSTQEGVEYHAGLVPESESEERQFGFPIIEIAAGLCVRTKLLDWSEHTDQIGPLIGQMIAQFGIDPSRPTMEYYRSQRELHLLVPIAQRPNDNSRNA